MTNNQTWEEKFYKKFCCEYDGVLIFHGGAEPFDIKEYIRQEVIPEVLREVDRGDTLWTKEYTGRTGEDKQNAKEKFNVEL